MNENFARNLKQSYCDNLIDIQKRIELFDQQLFGQNRPQTRVQIDRCVTEMFQLSREELILGFRSQSTGVLVRRFNDCFKMDDKGRPHNWATMKLAKISEVFDLCKGRVFTSFDELKKIALPQNLKQVGDSWSVPTTGIICEEDIERVREEVTKEINFIYEDAVQRHNNAPVQNRTMTDMMWTGAQLMGGLVVLSSMLRR